MKPWYKRSTTYGAVALIVLGAGLIASGQVLHGLALIASGATALGLRRALAAVGIPASVFEPLKARLLQTDDSAMQEALAILKRLDAGEQTQTDDQATPAATSSPEPATS